jgi:hypothetical protein
MRLLPDGTFHCPACGSEVLPLKASGEPEADHHSEAYWAGWVDSRFAERGSFVDDNPNLARWGVPSDRLEYYRGHRAGSEARRAARNFEVPKVAVWGQDAEGDEMTKTKAPD